METLNEKSILKYGFCRDVLANYSYLQCQSNEFLVGYKLCFMAENQLEKRAGHTIIHYSYDFQNKT